jgi:hypothetical protein
MSSSDTKDVKRLTCYCNIEDGKNRGDQKCGMHFDRSREEQIPNGERAEILSV